MKEIFFLQSVLCLLRENKLHSVLLFILGSNSWCWIHWSFAQHFSFKLWCFCCV